MKVLITGHLGFVGSATTKYFAEKGIEVVGYDLMSGQDIRDIGQLERTVNQEKPDRILHLAAIARFSEADKDPKLAFETNVLGTMNVVDVAERFHIPLVYSSTGSAIMPLNEFKPPFDETVPARGNSVYGCTKAQAEYYVQRHTPHIILRYGHLYGLEKRFHGLIGGFLARIERGAVPTLYGGHQTNSFVYIKDVAEANYLAVTAPYDRWNQIYNVGSHEEISAERAGELVCRIFNYSGEVEKKDARTVDPPRFWMDTTKSERMLDFKAKYTLEEGLIDMKATYDQTLARGTVEREQQGIYR